MSELVLLEITDGVATLTLNNPARRNALSTALLGELDSSLRSVERDDGIGAVVLTGAGGQAFSSGADLSEFDLSDGQPPSVEALLRTRYNPVVTRLYEMPKPVIAAVTGVAAGAGMSLALACDLRLIGEGARFVLSFARIGLVPDAGAGYFLRRLVGPAKALELAWTGDPVSAHEALRLGLANRVVPDEQVLEASQELAGRLAHGPRTAFGLMKRLARQSDGLSLERVLDLEAGYQEVASRTADFREGVTAFREKRPPRFTGT